MYGFNNGNPPFTGYPAMQNRLNNLEQQFGGQQFAQFGSRPQMPSYLKGRMVTSIDEAKASQFDLDGSITYFPSLAENKIYAKTLDNNGLPIFMQFAMVQDTPQQKVVVPELTDLVKRIERLEKEFGYEPNGTDSDNAK